MNISYMYMLLNINKLVTAIDIFSIKLFIKYNVNDLMINNVILQLNIH